MRAILLFLILIQTRGKSIQICPKYCTCKPGAQAEWLRIKCNNELQNIRDINIDSVSVELVQLDLSKNNIYAIEANIFKNLTNLKRLNLSRNDITFIDENCFNGLENLERLDLSKNQISTIDTYTFKTLSNLKRLDLSSNNISTMKPSLFHDLLALERLKLNENRLTTLMEGTFYSLKFLKQLDLSNNPWRCDCELYWFSNWIYNSSIKLSPAPKCASPLNVKGEFVKELKYSENIQCQWLPPTIELRPVHNQVVFAGDSITLKCRAPSITEDKNAKLSWLWYPNTTSEIIDLNSFLDPQKSLSNIKIDNRYLTDSGIVDSSLSIVPVKEEHNGQWNCLLVSTNGNRSKTISVIVISEETRYCPLVVTKNNKGMYTWPKTVVGWKAELPCEGNHLSGLMQMPLKASYQCNITGYWENLNTELCPYISHITKSLEQFSKVNLSLTKINLLETAKKFKNYTGNAIKITDPIEINFIIQTIENYLNFIIEEKELGSMLIDVISTLINVPKNILRKAEISFKSCTRIIKAVEKIIEFTPSIQFYKKNMALEEFRVKRDSFTGLICTWYSNNNPEIRFLQCTTNNRTSPINIKDRVIEASIHLPASLLHYSHEIIAYQLMISVYSNNKLFPKINNNDNMDIASCVIGSKLYGMSVQNLTEPVYIMLKVPLYYYAGKKLLPVVWDETLNKSGGWTSDGCHLRNVLNNLIVFHCNRLGYYGLLQDTSSFDYDDNSINGAKFRYSNPAIYIGSIATITCLIFMSVTYIICYTSITMPKKAKHCVINTWFAMALLSFFYSIGIYQTENIPICQGVGLILHYLSLCSLLWMAVFASNMYKKLSKSDLEDIPDNELQDQPLPKPLLGLYLVGWGIAMIICGISGAINLREYAGYSYCFLTSGPALVALFVPAGILIMYLIIFHLLIKCSIQNVDMNAQLSEGTQATENMDLELLEPNTNISVDRNSARSAQTVLSDIEDSEHSQITQLKGQTITLILYLISWITAAAAMTKPLNTYISFDETIFATLYSFFSSSLGIFILFFYGIARNDVRSQWLKMGCWFQKRKNRCCRTRSISDANPVIAPQSLVQNLVPPISNSQATQVTSDSNSISSSRYTNRSQTYNAFKITDIITNQEISPINRKMTNVNLVVLHRQQYRSDNSVTTYIEPTCVEMFYNPHQSGVARKFFRKQRRHTKNNNLGPRKQGDGGAVSDAGSCISVPRSTTKLESNIDQTILSSSAKVNNTNIHVELNPINDIKNVNILSDSGGSISEEKNVPVRFVIGQESLFRNLKKQSTQYNVDSMLHIPEPEYDVDYICNPSNRDIIYNNILARKSIGNIDKVLEFSKKPELKKLFLNELNKIPNQIDPIVLSYGTEPKILKECGHKPKFDFEPQEFSTIVTKLKAFKSNILKPLIGQRGYLFLGDLAELEEALINYTIKKLMKYDFKLVSVPDIIPTEIINRCGLISDDKRDLIYNLSPHYGNYSLSGTAEMSLAYKIMNTIFDSEDLPLKMAAVSRCFRAEVSNLHQEKGLYRVHQFTKVEMFVCSKHEESANQFQELQNIQENLFSSLNLHFRIIDMPSNDLGSPAYRKVDIEGWMPGKKMYGELSSCSNCTDYQSRRLGIKYKTKNGEILYVHTLNGTACAIPRMLIALCESYQTKHGRITVPNILAPYMTEKILIKKQKIADTKLHKFKIFNL